MTLIMPCCCGDPSAPGIVHRKDGPCYHLAADSAAKKPTKGTELKRTLLEDVFYPPHDPRQASSEYRLVHHKLVVEMDEPCWICGERNSSGAAMETHHSELEWAAERAFEGDAEMLEAITRDHAAIMNDPATLRQWLDSEDNMLVLCAKHHRGSRTGIHSITYPAWKLQRYQHAGGFLFVPYARRVAAEDDGSALAAALSRSLSLFLPRYAGGPFTDSPYL